MLKMFVAAAAMLVPATAQAADQFDLICSGFEHISTPDGDQDKPVQSHYRMDIKTKRWCSDDCGAIHPIEEIQEAYLKMEPSVHESTLEGPKTFFFMIDRITGKEEIVYSVMGRNFYASETKAQCKTAPFSGFPKLDKRF